MPVKSKTATSPDFSISGVVKLLAARGVLTDLQAQEVRSGYPVKVSEIRKKLRSRDSENPYISPIELLASFSFHSSNPRLEYMNEVEISHQYSAASGFPFARIDPLKLDAKQLCSIIS